ncbi:DUF1523 family protein [Pseudooceanicola sp. CBS1P-1]|uniref:DUF1523 family protein n=1 Tax=Pseudooceanicola albus TaxID=2692189 RepID=A0A6L7G844_9RHOB|nr:MULTISPECIES: DUF1523 family protein [Pseudooceanicola]MBT9384193.1 DUF1523 family protein [Pseudooceanicola endophyticus]MXN19708.1 DUF1523 family protein [Pseudooceanicola albus]
MRYVKWAVRIIVVLVLAAFFDYTLPQHDVVRVTDTFEKRIDFGDNSIFWSNSGAGNASNATNRDVFFIQTIRANGKPLVFRNEDTGWGWPPYFKFNTNNLQTEAADLKSTSDNPKWVRVTHYGWRNEFLSIFPNAVRVKQVSGPDDVGLPWFNTIVIVLFIALAWAIRVRVLRFWDRRIDPMMEDVGDGLYAGRSKLRRIFSRGK